MQKDKCSSDLETKHSWHNMDPSTTPHANRTQIHSPRRRNIQQHNQCSNVLDNTYQSTSVHPVHYSECTNFTVLPNRNNTYSPQQCKPLCIQQFTRKQNSTIRRVSTFMEFMEKSMFFNPIMKIMEKSWKNHGKIMEIGQKP